jgi:hypothetical protein
MFTVSNDLTTQGNQEVPTVNTHWRRRRGRRERRRRIAHRTNIDEMHHTFCLEKPGSTTYTTPSMVKEVSAMLVLTTTFLPGIPPGVRAGGASEKISCCARGGRLEYRGYTMTGPVVEGSSWSHSSRILRSGERKRERKRERLNMWTLQQR